jgi:acetylornithine deacetylase/succinyl-diaminopimelate desuccinylase-like protein
VLIPHFYDGIAPLGPLERSALAHAPVNDRMLMESFGLGHVDGGGEHLLNLINLPSLNINGISSGQTGAHAANVIPPTATADIDLRLVVGVDWREQQQRVADYIESRGYFLVETEPTPEILLAHPKIVEAVHSARGEVVLLPTTGGSVPLGAMERAANTRTITVPIANYDDNQHTANENLRLQNLWDGVETMAALLEMK